MSEGPTVIAESNEPGPLGALLRAVGRTYNCTSRLSIKPQIGGDGSGWTLVIEQAPFYTSEAAAYAKGFLDGAELHLEVWVFPRERGKPDVSEKTA